VVGSSKKPQPGHDDSKTNSSRGTQEFRRHWRHTILWGRGIGIIDDNITASMRMGWEGEFSEFRWQQKTFKFLVRDFRIAIRGVCSKALAHPWASVL